VTDHTKQLIYHCKQCNAELIVPAGVTDLICQYCGHSEEIITQSTIVERDYRAALETIARESISMELTMIHCDGCGADISVDSKSQANACPYCGKSYITSNYQTGRIFTPSGILPFAITRENGTERFKSWAKKRWFAPNDFTRSTKSADTIRGIYLPFWTFDTTSHSDYTGERGEYYYVSEKRTVTENGRNRTETVQVRKTQWHKTSGNVICRFDDLLICGSDSLPQAYIEKLSPWDLTALIPFDTGYLQGYQAEHYSIPLDRAFEMAKLRMEDPIRETICDDIGGDEQIVSSVQTDYSDIAFKHILLPVWVTAYRYGDKVFRIMINARTGEVQGERPWSWVKIIFTVLLAILLVLLPYLYSNWSAL